MGQSSCCRRFVWEHQRGQAACKSAVKTWGHQISTQSSKTLNLCHICLQYSCETTGLLVWASCYRVFLCSLHMVHWAQNSHTELSFSMKIPREHYVKSQLWIAQTSPLMSKLDTCMYRGEQLSRDRDVLIMFFSPLDPNSVIISFRMSELYACFHFFNLLMHFLNIWPLCMKCRALNQEPSCCEATLMISIVRCTVCVKRTFLNRFMCFFLSTCCAYIAHNAN